MAKHGVFKAIAGLCAALIWAPAQAQLGSAPEAPNTLQVSIREPGQGPASEQIVLPLGQAAVVHLPADAADVVIANDEVANAVVRTSRRAFVLSEQVGRTNIFFFDAHGGLILDLSVRVERDMEALQDALNRFIPDGRVFAESMNANIVLSGTVPSASAADTALQVARRWVDNPEEVISLLAVEGRDQVALRVRIVEMQRTIVRQLGVNLNGTQSFGDFDPARNVWATTDRGETIFDVNGNRIPVEFSPGRYQSTTSFGTSNGFGVAGAALGGLTGSIGTQNLVGGVLQSSIGATLNALERVGLVRTLAEPNITAISGESAQFLAGGEFPVPVAQDRDGNVTVEFKPFGVGLGFTPVVLSEGRISLRISTEVSDLSTEGAASISGGTAGVGTVTIPALTVNRAETTVELPSGGSLVIAGLIREETRQAMDSVPGVDRLPVLGSLFRSRDFANNETELVVVVTPYLVDPANPNDLEEPGEGFVAASVATNLFLGRLNQVYAAPGAQVEDQGWSGPIGYVLE